MRARLIRFEGCDFQKSISSEALAISRRSFHEKIEKGLYFLGIPYIIMMIFEISRSKCGFYVKVREFLKFTAFKRVWLLSTCFLRNALANSCSAGQK